MELCKGSPLHGRRLQLVQHLRESERLLDVVTLHDAMQPAARQGSEP